MKNILFNKKNISIFCILSSSFSLLTIIWLIWKDVSAYGFGFSKEVLKIIGVQFLHLFLVGCVNVAIFGVWKLHHPWSRNICLGMSSVLLWGSIGTIWSDKQQTQFHLIEEHYPITTKGLFEAHVRFAYFPPDLQSFLEKAQKGAVRMWIQPFIAKYGIDLEIKEFTKFVRSETQIMVPSDQVERFINEKTFVFSWNHVPEDREIYIRGIPSPMKSRKDTFKINGKDYTIPNFKGFLVYFKFESLDGRPLAVFF